MRGLGVGALLASVEAAAWLAAAAEIIISGEHGYKSSVRDLLRLLLRQHIIFIIRKEIAIIRCDSCLLVLCFCNNYCHELKANTSIHQSPNLKADKSVN